jgi:serine-type D-Ala-D-Ala carboxypeptidase (penicillin-binding protein 5/6)
MRYYSYRPPRIQREFPQSKTPITIQKYLLGFGFALLGMGVGLSTLYKPQLLDVVLSSNSEHTSTSSSSAKMPVAQADSLTDKMLPFLRTSSSNWKIQQASGPIQAIGGGPGLLKEALDAKATLSLNYETGEIYYSSNANRKMPMASTTKIMTAMVAMDLTSMDEQFTVELPATQVEPTVIGVQVGEKLSTRELIKAGLLTSGNDAMAVLAEGIGRKYGGNTELFVRAMNEKAKILGLKNTNFTNPQGYDNVNHYTTCEDLATLSRYALSHYPEMAEIVKAKEGRLPPTATHHNFFLPNWNMLIDTYPGADGIKIGNTGEAGHTTVATATREGKRVMAVVLGTSGILKRDMSAAELLNVGFSRLGISPYTMTEDILRTRVKDWY